MARYSKKSQDTVGDALHREKKGTLRSGRSGKKVTSRKQAIAIGLSEAREKGQKVPAAPKKATTKKAAAKKGTATRKRATTKKAASGRAKSRKTTGKKAAATRRKSSTSRKRASTKKAS